MPLLSVFTATTVAAPDARPRILTELSALVARELGKPEAYVMTLWNTPAAMTFAGSPAPACYAELKNVGVIEGAQAARLSAVLCEALARLLGVARDRIYIEFTNADGALWGFDGETFA